MRTTPATRHPDTGLRVGLGLLELSIGTSAVWGGVMLMTDRWNMPADWLRHTPFDSWLLPGLALVGLIGGTQLVAGLALLSHHPAARTASIAAGLILVGWIVVQLVWLRKLHPVMQPTMLAAGAAIIALASRLPRATVRGGVS